MSKLTDLEIKKAIAKIEGAFKTYDDGENVTAIFKVGNGIHTYESPNHGYNPLTDALNHQLMIKYKITVEFTRYYEHLKSTTVKAFYDDEADNGYGAYIQDKNPNKAICLAIIEAHK